MRTFILLTALLTASLAQAVPRTVDADRFKLSNGFWVTLPVVSSTVVLESGAQTLLSKSLVSPNISSPAITGGSVSGATILTSTITGGTASGVAITGGSIVSIIDASLATFLSPNLTTPAISGGTIAGAIIAGGTISGTTIVNATVSGATSNNGTFNNPTINGGTVSASAIVNAIITGSTINGASNTVSLNASSITAGVLPIARGGTNNGSLGVSAGAIAYMNGSGVSATAVGTSGQMLVSSGTATPVWADQQSVVAIAASDINWTAAGGTLTFTKTLSANTTFTFSGLTTGKVILVRLTNTASNYTVTWPTVRWTGGAAPVMTVGAKSDIYTFWYDGSNVYGTFTQNMF